MEIPLAYISYWLVAVLKENLIPKICRATGPQVLCEEEVWWECTKTIKGEKRESKARTDKCHISRGCGRAWNLNGILEPEFRKFPILPEG